jgi:hypothetical protein
MPDVFATKLCDYGGGMLWLGGFDATATTAPPQYTPLLQDDAYYTVALTSLAIEGTTVPVATSTLTATLVDTGSSLNAFPASVVDAITAALNASAGAQQVWGSDAGPPNVDLHGKICYQLSQTKEQLDAMLPPLVLAFGQGAGAITVSMRPSESYLRPYQGYWCGTLAAQDNSADKLAGIIGEPLMRSSVFVFDRAQQRLGIAPHDPCP